MNGVAFELALTEQNVALAEQRVARQRQILSELSIRGHPVGLAQDLLMSFENTLANHLDRRDRIRAQVALGSGTR